MESRSYTKGSLLSRDLYKLLKCLFIAVILIGCSSYYGTANASSHSFFNLSKEQRKQVLKNYPPYNLYFVEMIREIAVNFGSVHQLESLCNFSNRREWRVNLKKLVVSLNFTETEGKHLFELFDKAVLLKQEDHTECNQIVKSKLFNYYYDLYNIYDQLTYMYKLD